MVTQVDYFIKSRKICSMEPFEDDAVLEALKAREPIFHRREFGTTRQALEDMTDSDFWEIGASGKIYTREYAIDTSLKRYEGPEPHNWPCRGFTLRCLADNMYQINYTLDEPERCTRRTTLWRYGAKGWVILFHQGTVVA